MSQLSKTESAQPPLQEKNMIGYFAERKNKIAAVVMALIVGILFTTIIIEYDFGINVSIFSIVMAGCAGYAMYKDDNLNVGKYVFWTAVLLSIASVFFRLKSETYTVFAILLIPPVYIMLTIFSAKKLPSNIFVNALIRLFGSIAFVDKIFVALKSLMSGADGKAKKQTAKIFIGIGISAILLLMIVPLMLSADVVFNKFVVDFVDLSNIGEVLWKTVLALIIAILFFGFLYIITVKKYVPVTEEKNKAKHHNIETVIIVILGVVGAVYALFCIMQFTYLFGGSRSSLPDGFTVTEYARSGYFEQVTMTVINLGIIAVVLFLSENSKRALKKVINGLLMYFIAVSSYLMISSAYKMYLYQDMYGFTVLRLFVDILLIFEACVFIIVAIKIFKRKLKYLTCLLYFTAAFWAAVSFVNVEGLCVNLNIDRYENDEEIDIEYLARLDDASNGLKYLYTEHYDSLEKTQLSEIEDYFFTYTGGYYEFEDNETVYLGRALEYNLSVARKAVNAEEVLKFKNKR